VRQIRMLRAMRRKLETRTTASSHGHAGETPDTAKERPTGPRAGSRPYQRLLVNEADAIGEIVVVPQPAALA
jgi:hypothetical protein